MRFGWAVLCMAAVGLTGCTGGAQSGSVGTFNMGEKAQVGPLIYNVFDTQWLVTLGEGPAARVPMNRFFVIRLSVVNSGGSPQSVPTFTLVDDAGQTYTELDDGNGVPQFIGTIRRITPANSEQGTILFDVPPKHFKLRVAEETDQNYAFVDIPLRFSDPGKTDTGIVVPPPAVSK